MSRAGITRLLGVRNAPLGDECISARSVTTEPDVVSEHGLAILNDNLYVATNGYLGRSTARLTVSGLLYRVDRATRTVTSISQSLATRGAIAVNGDEVFVADSERLVRFAAGGNEPAVVAEEAKISSLAVTDRYVAWTAPAPIQTANQARRDALRVMKR